MLWLKINNPTLFITLCIFILVMITVLKTIYLLLCATYDAVNFYVFSWHRFRVPYIGFVVWRLHTMLQLRLLYWQMRALKTQLYSVVCEHCTVKSMHGTLNLCQIDIYESIQCHMWHTTKDNSFKNCSCYWLPHEWKCIEVWIRYDYWFITEAPS